MEIVLRFSSAWQNSFLGGSNDEPSPKGGRKYEASCQKLGTGKQFFRERPISHNTVMGVLNRLIGDQRKLFVARECEQYYFKSLEDNVSFALENEVKSSEVVFLRNFGGNSDPSGTAGMLLDDHLMFGESVRPLWEVLAWPIEKVMEYITTGIEIEADAFQPVKLSAFGITAMFSGTKTQKLVKDVDTSGICAVLLDKGYVNEKQSEKISVETMYCSAMYLMLEQMDITPVEIFGGKGLLPGISKRGFTLKDFMSKVTTGGTKPVYGNPYQKKILKKGEKAVDVILTKMDGLLRITLDVDREQAKEIKRIIDDAAVSAFTLGKKGLAYVDKIHLS
jgi:hypothetical protein